MKQLLTLRRSCTVICARRGEVRQVRHLLGVLLVAWWTLLVGAPCVELARASPAAEAAVHEPDPSPATAFLIALVPGAVLHGAGHLYAGDLDTAKWLALSEAAGYAAMFTSHARGDDKGDGSSGGAVLYGVGAGLFFGSWLYDVLEAPGAAHTRREATRQVSAASRWEVASVPAMHGVAFRVTRRF